MHIKGLHFQICQYIGIVIQTTTLLMLHPFTITSPLLLICLNCEFFEVSSYYYLAKALRDMLVARQQKLASHHSDYCHLQLTPSEKVSGENTQRRKEPLRNSYIRSVWICCWNIQKIAINQTRRFDSARLQDHTLLHEPLQSVLVKFQKY